MHSLQTVFLFEFIFEYSYILMVAKLIDSYNKQKIEKNFQKQKKDCNYIVINRL